MTNASSLLIALLLYAGVLAGQQPPARNWALETTNGPDLNAPPFHADVPERGEGLTIFHTPRWQPGWDRSDNTRPQATALKLTYRIENERVRLDAFVVLGPFDQNGTPQSLEGVPQKSSGVQYLRLGESVMLNDLAAYGLEPLLVRLVHNEPAVQALSQIINNTTALKVEDASRDWTGYRLSVRNLSPKAITGLSVRMSMKDGSSNITEAGTSGHPVIASGAVHELMFGVSPPDLTVAPQIVIDVIVFDDGSFEGSAEVAAGLEATRMAGAAQGRRVVSQVQTILDRGEGDSAAMIAAIRSQVAALPEEADSSVFTAIMSRYPGLPPAAETSVRDWIQRGLNHAKQRMLHSLKDYERNPAGSGISFQTWWEIQKQQLDGR
jgi:hypothetical protein